MCVTGFIVLLVLVVMWMKCSEHMWNAMAASFSGMWNRNASWMYWDFSNKCNNISCNAHGLFYGLLLFLSATGLRLWAFLYKLHGLFLQKEEEACAHMFVSTVWHLTVNACLITMSCGPEGICQVSALNRLFFSLLKWVNHKGGWSIMCTYRKVNWRF